MPGGDGTGPMGRGSMTGGAFGPCGGGRRNQRGFGRQFGRGVGFGGAGLRHHHRWAPSSAYRRWAVDRELSAPAWSPEVEREELRQEVGALERELERLRVRLAELDAASGD